VGASFFVVQEARNNRTARKVSIFFIKIIVKGKKGKVQHYPLLAKRWGKSFSLLPWSLLGKNPGILKSKFFSL
jgi:hypothetical protein